MEPIYAQQQFNKNLIQPRGIFIFKCGKDISKINKFIIKPVDWDTHIANYA